MGHIDKEMDLNYICEMESCLIKKMNSEISKGFEYLELDEFKEVMDGIKDLAETECKFREAEYYKAITEAMEKEGEDRWGYNANHYMNGHFAPKGHVNRSGFNHIMTQKPYLDDYLGVGDFVDNDVRMGYSEYEPRMNGMYMNNSSSRQGRAYDGYHNSKRHYTETKSHNDKIEMEKYSKEYIHDFIMAFKEMWADGDANQKHWMREQISELTDITKN